MTEESKTEKTQYCCTVDERCSHTTDIKNVVVLRIFVHFMKENFLNKLHTVCICLNVFLFCTCVNSYVVFKVDIICALIQFTNNNFQTQRTKIKTYKIKKIKTH